MLNFVTNAINGAIIAISIYIFLCSDTALYISIPAINNGSLKSIIDGMGNALKYSGST